jgi:dolichyl-phosphate-mannose--protein O-mannosyl transferase
MRLNIKLSNTEVITFSTLVDQEFDLDTTQLNNLATFMDVIKKNSIIRQYSNINNILQAVNYDNDDNNNYWIVLDINLSFYDIGIPHNAMIENNRLFENLSNVEIDIVSTILTCK